MFYHDPQLQPLTVNPATGATLGGNAMVGVIANAWFPKVIAVICVLGVISAAITSGDTALRSARLIVADFLHYEQKPIKNRLFVALPIFAITAGVLVYSLIDAKGFDVIWRYFAWSNQMLATVTLWTITVYLCLRHKPYVITLLPAMFMTMAKAMIQTRTMTGNSPDKVLEDVNNIICANNRETMFVTVWLGILDLNTGKLTAANAGHEYPIIKAPDGPFDVVKDKHGFVVGGMKGVKYKSYELQLEPGSKLFVYTDGIPEAKDDYDEMFGIGRTVQALNESAEKGPEQIIKAVGESVWAFVGDAEQFDDMTMLCIEYYGKNEQQ